MSRTTIAIALSVFLAPAAFALNNRSAVSSTGMDSNPCTVTSPCRSFGTAISATNPGGEVIALDSAGYGPFSITNAITVSGAPGVHAAITAPIGSGISITASGSSVTIRNLVLIGTGATFGVVQFAAGHVYLSNCLIRGFSTNIDLQNGDMTIDHCQSLDAIATGALFDNGGQATDHGVMTDCLIVGGGVYVSGTTDVSLVRTTITGCNTAVDAPIVTGMGFIAVINVKDCAIVNNSFAIAVASILGNSASVYLSGDLIAYNDTLVSASGTGAGVFSFQNNTIDSNTTAGGTITNVPLQ